MEITGVIAEYNPFHNGHHYHLKQTAALKTSDGVLAIMSGNFTQRGEAAVFDKWSRTEMALRCGVDLVLELPVAFAVRSAGYFAQGAVLSLAATGVVTHLSCGVESQNTNELQELAAILANEPPQFQQAIHQHLQLGLSFPAARQKALLELEIIGADQLQTPNNILALHYLQTIQQEHLSMQPIFIPRLGNYNDEQIPDTNQGFASATAIRKLLHDENSNWQTQIPKPVQEIIHRLQQQGYLPMNNDCFTQIVFALLRRSTPEQLTQIIEMTEGLENRLYTAAHQTNTLDELCAAVKSKRYTYTRIRRTLLHILLNINQDANFQKPTYLRVLGFNQTGQIILKEMKKKAQLPILVRPARQQRLLSEEAQRMLALDCRATNLYHLGYAISDLRKTNLDFLQMPVQV